MMDELHQLKANSDESPGPGFDADGSTSALASSREALVEDDEAIPTGTDVISEPANAALSATGTSADLSSRLHPHEADDAFDVRPYSMARLRLMEPDDLRAIENFEVSKPGFGTLFWPGRTDVRTVVQHGIEAILSIDKYRVKVYQGPIPIPAVGEGLNKRCVYTMEDVWARGPNGEYLRDARSLERLRAQLQRNADRFPARMVGYDVQRGEWTVEVDHW